MQMTRFHIKIHSEEVSLKQELFDPIKSILRVILLDFHIGLMISYSTLKITAVIMTAAKVAFGMYAQNSIKNLKD